ncbi:MAG: GNAT family N-acetyltransferase [Flammeovirgaceae bacterium]|nr:GNAT family N-acetyltransferase [Flammeovirgaceae bacterium]HCX23882.1 GNAT family N-acetyltransferase [Cytophagales bacterium]|tara:strand:+ start:2669 stop:3100 length:432 start_codon:yes stop_codon:yes gene_type:complete
MIVVKADTEELQKKAFAIRNEVFVVEQGVPAEAEMDEYESMCTHFVALDESNNPVGAARWRRIDKGVKLERFAVKKSYRGKGVGSKLVEAVLKDIEAEWGSGIYIYLHSQLPAVPLYLKYGFEKEGGQFSECDILHYKMHRKS